MAGPADAPVGNAGYGRFALALAFALPAPSTRFDAVLIDLEMLDTDGRALAAVVRQGYGLNVASMLILISAAENQAAGQVWPFDGFLQKPNDGSALAQLIGPRM